MNLTKGYVQILEDTKTYLIEHCKDILMQIAVDDNSKLVKSNIKTFLSSYDFGYSENDRAYVLSELIEKIYNSMCEYDILTKYVLDEKFILENQVEEININAWDEIFITDKNGTNLIDDTFPSARHCKDIIDNLASKLDKTVNEGTPIFLGEIRKNIRIACAITPIIDDEVGVVASIRIVSLKNFTRNDLISKNTATEEMFTLLEKCLSYSANICMAGATNSGKTATVASLISEVDKLKNPRILTVEIESREFNLKRYNEKGRVCNNVVSFVTRESDDPRHNVNASTLVDLLLRFSGELIVVGEMRNHEALLVCETATTGHSAITTIHSDNALDTYDRIVMLCKKSGATYDDNTLYKLAIKAFPIIAYQKRMEDKKSRKIVEILEGIEYKDGKVVGNTLYKYEIETSTKILVTGKFVKKDKISDNLRQKLIDNGLSREIVEGM